MHGIHTALDVILEYAPGLKGQNLASHSSLPVSPTFLDFFYCFDSCSLSVSVGVLNMCVFLVFKPRFSDLLRDLCSTYLYIIIVRSY